MKLYNLVSTITPLTDYASAAQRILALQAAETADERIQPVSRPKFFTHGHKTPTAVLWLHGYTNSPQQFEALGQACFELGWNVLIPRAPHHGLVDLMNTDQALLTAEELVAFADQSFAMAAGLGERLVVGGLSMGGLLTAWLAQQRPEIDLAMIIAPALAYLPVPLERTRRVAQLSLWLPNRFRWWNPSLKNTPRPPFHQYKRYATRALAHILRVSFALQELAKISLPAARQVWAVTNDNDDSVDNRVIREVLAGWRSLGANDVHEYIFGKEQNLLHDLIDPAQRKQQVDKVYPVLVGILEK